MKSIDEKKHGVKGSNSCQKEVNRDATTCPETLADAMKSFGKEVHEKNVAKLSKDRGHLSHSNPATQTASDAEPSVRLGSQAPRNGRGKRQRIGSPLSIPEMSSAVIPLPSPVIGKRSSLSKDVHRRIGKFFFESGLELDAVNLPSFRSMMCAGRSNVKTELPSYKDLEGWILEEEWKEMQQYATKMRESWTQTGCSILLDGWQDAGGRSLVNILVASPKGTMYLRSADITGFDQDNDSMVLFLDKVLREVGTKNVVQVITYTTSPWMAEVGKSIKEKYTNLFWTVSVSHCIELMLEEIAGVQHTLVEGKTAACSRQEGKRVADKASMPLVCALEFLSESSVPSVAYVYHIMDVAKEKIKTEFKGKRKSSYMPFWNAIDGIWENILHSPLHAAAAYLNPFVYYKKVYSGDKEVSDGLLHCINCMPKPEDTQLVSDQVNCYGLSHTMSHSALGRGRDDLQSDLSPASWWQKYGLEVPELQQLAIRILSQTCDGAEKYKLKRSLAERFLTERKNREEHKRLLFVQYNLHLQNFTAHVDDHQVVEWMKGMQSWMDSTKK